MAGRFPFDQIFWFDDSIITRFSAQGAYLLLPRRALIRDGRNLVPRVPHPTKDKWSKKRGRTGRWFIFWGTTECWSRTLEIGLAPGSSLARKSRRAIIRLKEICTHMDIIVNETQTKTTVYHWIHGLSWKRFHSLKRKWDICVETIKPSQNTVFGCTPILWQSCSIIKCLSKQPERWSCWYTLDQ